MVLEFFFKMSKKRLALPVHQVVVFAAVVSGCPQVGGEFVEALGAVFDLFAKQRVF